jgi:hypothetical protein
MSKITCLWDAKAELGEGVRYDAITMWAIDECNGKLDVMHSKTATNEWKN